MAVDSHGMPVRFLVTDATVADCTVAEKLIYNFPAQYLLADRAYDTDEIVEKAIKSGMIPVIPPKKNRKILRDYDKYIYRLRHLVENAFLHLKSGAVLPLTTLKTSTLSLLPSKLGVSLFG